MHIDRIERWLDAWEPISGETIINTCKAMIDRLKADTGYSDVEIAEKYVWEFSFNVFRKIENMPECVWLFKRYDKPYAYEVLNIGVEKENYQRLNYICLKKKEVKNMEPKEMVKLVSEHYDGPLVKHVCCEMFNKLKNEYGLSAGYIERNYIWILGIDVRNKLGAYTYFKIGQPDCLMGIEIRNEFRVDPNIIKLQKKEEKTMQYLTTANPYFTGEWGKRLINEIYGVNAVTTSTNVNYSNMFDKKVFVKKKTKESILGLIKDVIFNDPATIVFWRDGSKTVVKAENEPFDPEKGLAMAIAKRTLGNEGNYYELFKKWVPKKETSERPSKEELAEMRDESEMISTAEFALRSKISVDKSKKRNKSEKE